MLTITVAQDGSGDFASVSEAVLAVPYACTSEIRIGPGVYREKLVCEKQDITLIGAGMESTRIVWGDGGRLPHPDGRPTHTFRSYTAFFRGTELRVQDLTIENDAGPGAKVGQAVAAHRKDCRAGLPPWRTHRAGGLFRVAEPHRLRPCQLCRSGQHRRGRSSARCMGEAAGQPAGRRAAQMCTEALQTGIKAENIK